MNMIVDGWFSEISDMWPGRALSIKIREKLLDIQSPFQHIVLYETENCGKMLVLDDIIQFTEDDEFAYQEMLAHLPMFCHPNPERVLVIGGGDGGVLRELSLHECVKHIDICEIDQAVVDVCRKYVPSLSCGFDDPRVNVHIGDGIEFIGRCTDCYDVIIVDSSDPVGPGIKLFEDPFYRAMRKAIHSDGIIATQGESFFMHSDVVCDLMRIARNNFPITAYSYMMVPTYPGGTLGVCLGSMRYSLSEPCRKPTAAMQAKLRYYTSDIHRASMVLPAFGARLLEA